MADEIITAERLRELLHYDTATGVFVWRTRPGPAVKVGDVAGFPVKGYRAPAKGSIFEP